MNPLSPIVVPVPTGPAELTIGEEHNLGGIRMGRENGRLCSGPCLQWPAVISNKKIQAFCEGKELTNTCAQDSVIPLDHEPWLGIHQSSSLWA